MPSIYLAGPMRGYPRYNFDAFEAATKERRAAGYEVFSPAERDLEKGFDPDGDLSGFDLGEAMKDNFTAILQADWIVLLEGWEKSQGARAERFVAEQAGKKVWLYKPDDLLTLKPAPAWDHALVDMEEGIRLIPSPVTGEVRVTDPETGGQKGTKPSQPSMIPPRALLALGEVYGMGAARYDRDNWAKGYRWSLSFDALLRHLIQFWGGEDDDRESGLSHLSHAAWHCFTLFTFADEGLGTDDRRKP